MFLIYIIGGIIPFVIATFYISQQSRNLILEQNKKAQQEQPKYRILQHHSKKQT